MIYRLAIDCFHATPEVERAFDLFRQDHLFAKSRVTLRSGGLAAAVSHYRDNASPQVVIVEETEVGGVMLERLAQMSDVCVAGTRVVVVGQLNDIGVYRALLAQGVSEYLILPVTPQQIADTIASIFSDPTAAPRGRLIAFFGARGGTGCSALAHNTAWALAQATAEDVILLDLDRAFGTLGLACNVDARQTVGEILGEPERIDAQLLDRLLVKHDDHLQLLPSPSELRDWPPIEVEAVDKLFDLVRQMAPFVVADLPHLWAPWIGHILEMADDLVIVAQPDLPNLRDVKNLLDGIGRRRGERLPTRLVVNKVDAYKKSQITAKDFEETIKIRPLAIFPFDPFLPKRQTTVK